MPSLVIDIETTGLNPFTVDKINIVGIKDLEEYTKVYFIRDFRKHEIALKYLTDSFDIRPIEKLKDYLQTKESVGKVNYIYHNGKFDSLFTLVDLGIDLPITHDTMILVYLTSTVHELTMNRGKWLSLKSAAQRILGGSAWDVDLATKTGIGRDTFEYLSKDLDYTGELYKVLYPKLTPEDKITYAIIMKALNVFRDVERNGIPICVEELESTYLKYKLELETIDKQLAEDYPDTNFNSSKQVIDIIYKQLGFPIKKLTKKGNPSVAVGALKELEGQHRIIDLILEKRNKEKALTFLKDWKEKNIDGRLYPTFNLHTTVTGRTSCNKPNIQQVPRNKDLKSLFDAPGGNLLVQIDYSQMELRMAAIVANVKAMKETYRQGGDIHTEMAQEIVGKEEVSKQDRTLAKPVNFGFIYGMAAKTFPEYAKTTYGMDISVEQAIELREMFFKKYPELIYWYEGVKDELLTHGEVKTLLGRRYSVGFENLLNKKLQVEYIRKAINAKVQSPSSDYALLGLIHLHEHIKTMPNVKICATVHDSIILEVESYKADTKKILKELKAILERPNHLDNIVKYLQYPKIDIPIVADVEVGPWGSGEDLEDWEVFPF